MSSNLEMKMNDALFGLAPNFALPCTKKFDGKKLTFEFAKAGFHYQIVVLIGSGHHPITDRKPIQRASMTLNSLLTPLSPHQVVLLAMLSKLIIMLMESPLVLKHQSITSLLPASTSPPPSRTKLLVSRVPLIIQLLWALSMPHHHASLSTLIWPNTIFLITW